MNSLERLLRDKRVVVCCGAGGVGKTTVSATLAIAAARCGQRVLVLTIDPSRRLAELLNVHGNPKSPVPLDQEALDAAGISGSGTLHTWILNSMQVADETVEQAMAARGSSEQFLDNPIYRQISRMASGMQEYTAMKALYRFVDAYDLIVLDTPPSRHALDFLDAPGRLERFLDFRVFQIFLPAKQSAVHRAAAALITRVLERATGKRFARNFVAFLSQFREVFGTLQREVSAMRTLLASGQSSFVVVTSSAPEALREAHLFRERAGQLDLPFAGFVLNRSCARMRHWTVPGRNALGAGHEAISDEVLSKLQTLAETEHSAALADEQVVKDLAQHAGSDALVVDIPQIHDAGTNPASLGRLARVTLEEDGSRSAEVTMPPLVHDGSAVSADVEA